MRVPITGLSPPTSCGVRKSPSFLHSFILPFLHSSIPSFFHSFIPSFSYAVYKFPFFYSCVFFLHLSLSFPPSLSPSLPPSLPPAYSSLTRIPLGLLSSAMLSAIWLSPAIAQPEEVDYDAVGVVVFCVAAMVELLTEPLWVLGQTHQYISLKVRVCVCVCVCVCPWNGCL